MNPPGMMLKPGSVKRLWLRTRDWCLNPRSNLDSSETMLDRVKMKLLYNVVKIAGREWLDALVELNNSMSWNYT